MEEYNMLWTEEIMRIPENYKKLGKLEVIGKGSLGKVFRIRGSQKIYALKIVNCGTNKSIYEATIKEIEMLEHLGEKKNIVRILDASEATYTDGKVVYILEEYGMPMPEYIENADISVSGMISIIIDIANAIQECQNCGIIHLDIQPKNIFFDVNGKAILGDFSSALFLNEIESNKIKRGTLSFMAPEVFRENDCGIYSDIYSIGVLLYWLLNATYLPFMPENDCDTALYKRLAGVSFPRINSINKNLMDEIECIINDLCAFDKSRRCSSIAEVICKLNNVLVDIKIGKLKDDVIHVPSIVYDADSIATTCPIGCDAVSFSTEKVYCSGEKDDNETNSNNYLNQMMCSGCGQLISKENYCPNCGRKIVRKNTGIKNRMVDFSAIAPHSFVKGKYSLINVFLYENEFRKVIDDIIAKSEIETCEIKHGAINVYENAKIKMIISTPEFEIEDDTEEREWVGGYLDFNFSILVPQIFEKEQIPFTIVAYINGIMTTRLKFVGKVTKTNDKQKLDIYREDVESAFVSYAEEDKNKVMHVIQGILQVRPEMDIYMDADLLRKKKEYNYTVKKEIDYRDVLYLCWSEYTCKSKNVELEWKYALERKGITGIEALPIENSVTCPPPDELRELFNDKIFYLKNKGLWEIHQDIVLLKDETYLDKSKKVAIKNGDEIKLSKLEYLMLECFSENIGRTLCKDKLGEKVWGNDYYNTDTDIGNAVRRIIKQLREKLGENIIDTINGLGYRI